MVLDTLQTLLTPAAYGHVTASYVAVTASALPLQPETWAGRGHLQRDCEMQNLVTGNGISRLLSPVEQELRCRHHCSGGNEKLSHLQGESPERARFRRRCPDSDSTLSLWPTAGPLAVSLYCYYLSPLNTLGARIPIVPTVKLHCC